MSFVDYLLLSFGLVLVCAFGILLFALRRAGDGHEDPLGFHAGTPAALSVLASMVGASPSGISSDVPERTTVGMGDSAEGTFTLETASPFMPKARRRSVYSRPPILPANLSPEEFVPPRPSPSVIPRRARKAGSALPLPNQSQFPFPDPTA